jgi:hypothetical protein
VKTTVQIEGKSVEVDIPGVVPEADVAAKYMPKEVVEQIVKDRLSQFAKGHVKIDELDAIAIQQIAEKKGLKLATSTNDDIGKQITQAKTQWSETELKPVIEREQAARAEVDTLRRGQLRSAIRAAGARFFKDVMLTPPVAGAASPLETMLEPAHGFNETTKTWHVKGTDGFAISSDPSKYGVYKTPEEAVAELAKNPAYKDFLRVETQSGPVLGGGSSGGGEGRLTVTPAQASDAAFMAEALKKVGGDYSRIVIADPKMQALAGTF